MDRSDQSLWFAQALLPEGWARDVRLTVAGGRIAKIETGTPRDSADEAHAIAIPGLPNLHSHAFQRAMAGLTETRGPSNDSFWTWRELMYRFVATLNPDQVEAIAAMAFAEMLESGFTRVGEFHYLHKDVGGVPYANPGEMAVRVANAARETGIALTLLPVFYAHSGFGGQAPKPSQQRFIHDVDGFARLLDASRKAVANLDDAIVGVAPHSLRAVTPEQLTAVTKLADGAPVHIHIAEQTKEVEDCVAWSGKRPVEWLLANNKVDESWCLVHATHMSAQETRDLAYSKAVAGLCPITEANLGDGVFPAVDFLSGGGRFGVGSDSNVLIDAAEELRLLEYGQRLSRRSRNVLADDEGQHTGAEIFRAALSGGAQALGRKSSGLNVGQSADIVCLKSDHPALSNRNGDALLDSWIFAARNAVDHVWRHGMKVVDNGRHIARDRIARRYCDTLKTIIGAI
ncbi:MAG TPA: formimidoylglutamate deiminase [Rhizomicrobium sp.]|nr:formimidoylglutamate deiminase [Rhizomicrobium sp.]